MPRGTKHASEIFKSILKAANDEIITSSKKVEAAFTHRTIRGDEKATILAQFLAERLPSSFGIAKGEAIDCFDNKTGQLDLIVYDKNNSAPFEKGGENLLLPCEAIYAIIEVKSILSQNDLEVAFKSAQKIRKLRPFKKNFIAPRKNGAAADDEHCRCAYSIFAFSSNLSEDDWISKEFKRIKSMSELTKCPLDSIDRVFVLNRGIIHPAAGVGEIQNNDEDSLFLEFFLHLANFIRRESERRPSLDWQVYTSRTASDWVKITT